MGVAPAGLTPRVERVSRGDWANDLIERSTRLSLTWKLGEAGMSEPTWLPRIARCDEVYFLLEEDDLGAGKHDTYLALVAENGSQYRLRLSVGAVEALYQGLTTALQSEHSPLRSPPGPQN